MDKISDFLSSSEYPVILGLNETWLDSSVADGAVMADRFKLYQRDRKHGRGGGILVQVH